MKSWLHTYPLCPIYRSSPQGPICPGDSGEMQCLGCPGLRNRCVLDFDENIELFHTRLEMLCNNDPDVLDPDHVYGPATIWTCCTCGAEFTGGRAASAQCPACDTINLFGGGYVI